MFIYKITIVPINKCYIGFDTKEPYKESRWKTHQKESKINPKGKLHKAINKYGVKNCVYEIIEKDFKSITKLAIAEINYIKEFDSYKNGLNSTPGGDGLNQDLKKYNDEEIKIIKEALGEKWRVYNNKKYKNTTVDERKAMIKHCHTSEANKNRAETLRKYYNEVEGSREKHSAGIKKWQKENPELARQMRIKNALKGAAKTSKRITIIDDLGKIYVYNSISEFQRLTGKWMTTLRKKTANNEFYDGYKLVEQTDEPI